ncbi:alpha/beta fold hydrolase [Mycobacterium neumannii]|uniref:alpha/beta fold hydrolase n=1 Tax=Mycobacterium neumannii TaxID=2048551 RepID=UPI00192F60E2|nr:alpha/beta hydrolase [Mycobacterium neumannii]
MGDVDWYCERRGDGPPIVLVPSGEGDCGSFDRVAAALANEFSVLTFDMPGFSRSRVTRPDLISVPALADQIAELVASLSLPAATYFGCSSGGVAVLDLIIRHGELVRRAVVHEVAMSSALALLNGLVDLDDSAVIAVCRDLFANLMNDDAAAWEALGADFHKRLEPNYVTWVRRYVAAGIVREPSPDELVGKPITWTIGGLSPAATFLDNVVLAVRAGISITTLMCKHFPQVSTPDVLAEHIRAAAVMA